MMSQADTARRYGRAYVVGDLAEQDEHKEEDADEKGHDEMSEKVTIRQAHQQRPPPGQGGE